jgi:3-hydroxypropanoate dehydrogenase
VTDPSDVLGLCKTAQDVLLREAGTANALSVEPLADTDEHATALYSLVEVEYAPHATNTQPLRILVIRSRAARERLAAHMAESDRAKTAAAPLTAVLAYEPELLVQLHDLLPAQLPRDPAEQCVFSDKPRRSDAAKLNALIQAGYFILGLRALGLTAGQTTGFHNEGVDQEFFAENGYRSLVVVTIGKPGENVWFPRDLSFEPEHLISTV